MLYFLVIPFLLIGSINCSRSRWIDPHDMNTNVKQKYTKPSLTKSKSLDDSLLQCEVLPKNNICPSHLKRTISILLNSASIDKRDPDSYKGQIYFRISPEDLEFLTMFVKEDLSVENLRRFETIISEGFQKSFIDEYLHTMESFQQKLYSVVVNIYNLWLMGVICLLYVVFQLFKNNFSFSYILKYLILLIWICDYGFRYNYLLEEAEKHNLDINYSEKCNTARMTWSEWVKFWINVQDCEKRTVTPLDTLLYEIKSIIIVPLGAFGTGMAEFTNNVREELPFPWNYIFLPLLLVAGIFLILSIMVIFSGQQIEFGIFHLLNIKFGGKCSECKEKTLQPSLLETILDKVMHRPMVQNINVSVPSTNSSNTQESPVTQCKVTGSKKDKKRREIKDTTKSTSDSKTNLEVPDETSCCKTLGANEEEKFKAHKNDNGTKSASSAAFSQKIQKKRPQ